VYPCDWQLVIPDALSIKCDHKREVIRLSISNLSYFHSYYLINPDFNTIGFTNLSTGQYTEVTIPKGNYRWVDLCLLMGQLYAGLTCEYNSPQNTITFRFTTPHRLHALTSYKVFGFSNKNQVLDTDGNMEVTSGMLQPFNVNKVCFNLLDVTPAFCYNLDNSNSAVTTSNVLLSFIDTSAPFEQFQFENSLDYGIHIAQQKLNCLHFRITDFDGNLLTYFPEWECCIKLEVFRIMDTDVSDKSLSVMEDIRKYTKLNFIMKGRNEFL
jgi:hypothetical protein